MSKRELRLTLLENGLDFIREGVEALYGVDETPPAHAYKYALLHIFSGTLLVLKERLRRAHPSLIMKDVGQKLSPDVKTVDFDEVLRRLDSAVGVILASDDKELLRSVQKQRNALEHSEAQLEIDHVNALVGNLIEFLERFLREELKDSIFRHVSRDAGGEIAELAKIAEGLRAERHAEWRARAQAYFQLDDEELARLAEREPYHPKHNPDPGSFLECPQCYRDTAVMVDRDIAICTNPECRDVFEVAECPRCGGISRSEHEYCPDCASEFQRYMERD